MIALFLSLCGSESRNSLLFYIVQEQRRNTISFNCRIKLQTRRRINIVEIIIFRFFFLLNQNRAPNSFVSVENCIEYRRLSKNDTTGNASHRRNEIREDSERCTSTGNDRVRNEDIHLLRCRNLNGLSP